jgi:Plant ATP synthase F0
MPQLDLVTFLSQYFWLLVAFIVFYFYLYKSFLPKMYRIYSVREKLIHKSSDSELSISSGSHQASQKKHQLLHSVLSNVQQAIQARVDDQENWKNEQRKQVIEKSFGKVYSSFKKAVSIQSLSQWIVLKFAAPYIYAPATQPKSQPVLNKKLGNIDNWEAALLASPSLYLPLNLLSKKKKVLKKKPKRKKKA